MDFRLYHTFKLLKKQVDFDKIAFYHLNNKYLQIIEKIFVVIVKKTLKTI